MEPRELPLVIPPAGAEPKPVARARGARMAVLVGPQLAHPRFITRRFVLEPGAYIPEHRHDTIEHEQVMVRGEMALGLAGERRVVRAGDAMLIPAGVPHSYENTGTGEAEFICVVPATDGYATEWLEDPPEGAYPG